MPRNKKESFIFTLIMCTFMVFFMTLYNMIRIHGFSSDLWSHTLTGFPLGFIVALIADWFLVGPLAKEFVNKRLPEDAPIIKRILFIQTSMVSGMVIIMSLFGALMGIGLTSALPMAWLINIPYNFIVALPLQLILAGPLVRMIFQKLVLKSENMATS